MADAGDPNLNVGYAFEVKDEATKSLGKIEGAYSRVVAGFDNSMKKMPKVLDQYSEFMSEAGESTEKAGEQQKKSKGQFAKLKDTFKDNALSLEDLGISWTNFIKIAGALSVGAAIYGIYSFLKNCATAALEFSRQLLKLNQQYSMTAKETAVAGGALLTLDRRFGYTREQASELVGSLLDLGFKPKKGFIELAKATQDFSVATGIAASGAARFVDEATNVLGIPPIHIRGLGNAIKYVADQTRFSSDELAGMLKILDPLILRSGMLAGTARTKLAAGLIGLAGALKDADVGADGFFKTISEVQLGKISEAGQTATFFLSALTHKSQDFYESLSKTDPARLMDEFANAAAKLDPELEKDRIQLTQLADAWGSSYDDILKVRQKALAGHGDFFEKAAKAAAAEAQKQDELTAKAAKTQARLDAISDRFRKLLERIQLAIGGKLLRVIETRLLPPVEKFLNSITAKDINDTLNTTVDVLSAIGSVAKLVFGGIFGLLGEWFSSVRNTAKGVQDLIEGDPIAAIGHFKDAFIDSAAGILKSFFGPLNAAIEDVFGVSLINKAEKAVEAIKKAFRDALEWLTPKFKSFAEKLPGYSLIEKLVTRGSPEVKNSAEKLVTGDSGATPSLLEPVVKPEKVAGVASRARLETQSERAERSARESAKAEVAARTKFETRKAESAIEVSFPDSMTTSSPAIEVLLKEQVRLLQSMLSAGRSLAGSVGSSAGVRAEFLKGNL